MSDLDFELDIDARTAGLADAVTELDALEKQFKSSKDELGSLEKSFADTDKSLEKLSSQLADTRIAMQRAMQEGDDKKFWKLAQTTDDLTKKEEALRKKSAELKTSIDAQKKTMEGASDAVSHARDAEKALKDAGEASDKRSAAASALLDRYGGKLGGMAKSATSAAEEVGSLTEGLGMSGTLAIGAAAGLALVAVAVLAVGAAFVSAAAAVYKFAVEQANAKRNTEQTLRALTLSNDAAKETAASFEEIGHATGASDDTLLGYSRGLTEQRRQQGLAAASTKDLQDVMRAAALTSQALDDPSAGQAIVEKYNAGASAVRLLNQAETKYGDVVKQKMLGLDQQMTTLERNLSGLTEHFDVKPVLEGFSQLVKLTDKSTESGKFLQDMFDTVFGKSTGSLVEEFFVQFELQILKAEMLVTDAEIYFYKFKNAIEKMTDIDLGPFGNLHDRINDVANALKSGASTALDLMNPLNAIERYLTGIGIAADYAVRAYNGFKDSLKGSKMQEVASDSVDGYASGLSKGNGIVQDSARKLGSAAVHAMKEVLDSHSPSRVFEDIGLSIPQGLELGVDAGATNVAQSIDALVTPPQLPQGASSGGQGASSGGQGASSGGQGASGGANAAPVFNITIQGVAGVEDALDQLEEKLTAIWERRALGMGIDAETSGAT